MFVHRPVIQVLLRAINPILWTIMIDLKYLLELDDFRDLDDAALVDAAEHAIITEFQPGDCLLAEDMDRHVIYLLDGSLTLQATDGGHQDITANSQRTQRPIFFTDTPGHVARCNTVCKVLQVKSSVLDKYGIRHKRDKDDLDYAAFDTLPAGDTGLSLMNEITRQFKSKSVTLPSLPEVALHINTALEQDDMDTTKMSQIIQMDPVIVARVVQVANGVLYGGGARCDTIYQAVSKIGLEGVRTIVRGVVLRDLFMPNTESVTRFMAKFYEHSIRIGLICQELAENRPDFDPEQAFLAGLLHDIGVVPVLVVADKHTELAYKSGNLQTVLEQLKSYIGGMILQQWGFAEEYVTAAKQAYDWERRPAGADYCDLVQVALLHSHLAGGEKINGPLFSDLPAVKRLGLDRANPVVSMGRLQALTEHVNDLVSPIAR